MSCIFRKIALGVIFSFVLIFAQAQQGVYVKETGDFYEIRNGILGIVIPSSNAFKKGNPCPAPIQSFIYADGRNSDNTVNQLQSPTEPISMRVDFLVKTKDRVMARVMYKFEKKEFQHYDKKYKGGEAGPGFYKCEIIVEKNKKTIIIEEDTNYDITYTVNISNGLSPDKARYRGWSSSAVQYGYESPGKLYRSELDRGYPMDATVDIDYSKQFKYPNLVLWEPAGGEQNSGRYWQVYNSKNADNANLFGFFQGKPERLIGAKSVGVYLQIFADEKKNDEKEFAGVTLNINRRGPDNSWFSRKRFQWVAFISTKDNLLSPEKQQPIANELNRISGLGEKILSYASKPVKIIPAFYDGAIYMPVEKIHAMCERMKTDGLFYQRLVSLDGAHKGIWDAWLNPDSAIVLKNFLLHLADSIKEQYINGEGTFLQKHRYWKGSNQFKYYCLAASALFADKTIKISGEERKGLEQLIGLMARIVWDDNNVPLFDSSGINLGPNNMHYMYNNNGRTFFALLLANDPEFSARAKLAAKSINADIEQAIYANGASFGTPHYIQPTVEPILFSMMQLKQAGVADLFRENKKIVSFARFYLTLLTPPSVRFDNNRKLVSFGDGSEESAVIFGLLGEGLKGVDSSLSDQLFSSFLFGPVRGSIFGSIGLTLDLTESSKKKYQVTSCNYDGYVSHFRSGLNAGSETALWVLNGDSLYDHRNDDAGEVSLYALKAPLSVSRSSFYYPHATDARIRSVVIPEEMFPEWDKADQPISQRSLTNRTWPSSTSREFANLGNSISATVMMKRDEDKVWYRKINMITVNEDMPIIIFYDSVSGGTSNIWSMPMMSEGKVHTSVADILPERRIYGDKLQQLPSASRMHSISPGLHQFVFNGQPWLAHPSNGINWELYSNSPSNIDFTISEWGTTWQNSIEKAEFEATNNKPYSEVQQIIRFRSDKPFFNILLPFAKGTTPYAGKVGVVSANTVSVQQRGENIVINPDYYAIKSGSTFCGGLLSATGKLSFSGVEISGGYTELQYDSMLVKVRVHGNSGIRRILLPVSIARTTKMDNVQLESFPGSTLLTIDYISEGLDLSAGQKGYKEFVFRKD